MSVRGIATFICCLALESGVFALAAEDPSGKFVEPAEAMRSIGRATWYDRSEDAYAPPSVRPAPENPLRTEGWLAKKKDSNGSSSPASTGTGGAGGGWFGWGGLASDWFSAIVLILLGILLAIVIGMLAFHSLRNYLPGRHRRESSSPSIEIDPAKVVDLPFEAQQAAYENPLTRAEALMQAGKFREAIVYLYAYQLLALDRSRKIDLQKGKTNRMYLRELKHEPRLRSIVERTMLAFEDVFFGQHSMGAQRFQDCWQTLPDFHRDLATPVDGQLVPVTGSVIP